MTAVEGSLRTYDPYAGVEYRHVPTPDVVVWIPPTDRPPVPPSRR